MGVLRIASLTLVKSTTLRRLSINDYIIIITYKENTYELIGSYGGIPAEGTRGYRSALAIIRWVS